MKKVSSVLILFTLLILSACTKDNDPEMSGPNVSFKVNGTLKQASGDTKVTAFYYTSQNTLQFMGNLENNQAITLAIQNYKGAGDYDVANADILASYVIDLNAGLNGTHLGDTGIIKIISATDKVVKGTFEFVARDPVTNAVVATITEGKFEANILVI